MKNKRIIVKGPGVYHVYNRAAYARYILKDTERDMFVKMMWQQAAFCGVEVLAYCIMSNHYHMLVRVNNACEVVDDTELLRRYRHLYHDDPAPRTALRPSDLEAILAVGDTEAARIRKKLHQRMHCLPIFMKELQQRFGIWYNMTHGNKGTLWAERFRSVMVQNNSQIMRVVAAYIELNPVRAAIVDRPELFRWCSLSAALTGDRNARSGIQKIAGDNIDYKRALDLYIRGIYPTGGRPGCSGREVAKSEAMREDLKMAPSPSTSAALSRRASAFTRGLVLGTADFVRSFGRKSLSLYGRRPRKKSIAHPISDSECDLFSLRRNDSELAVDR